MSDAKKYAALRWIFMIGCMGMMMNCGVLIGRSTILSILCGVIGFITGIASMITSELYQIEELIQFTERKKNGIIEENLGENCEPPEYTESIAGKDVFVCKTKFADFYDTKCAKDTCRCVNPDTGEEALSTDPDKPILTPVALCGNGILNVGVGEQCDAGIPCPGSR